MLTRIEVVILVAMQIGRYRDCGVRFYKYTYQDRCNGNTYNTQSFGLALIGTDWP